jgi:hypothetical protein
VRSWLVVPFWSFEVFGLVVLAALEHKMLEQMGETGAAGLLVLAAHVIPQVHRHHRRLAVGMHDHAQAVGQGEFVVLDLHLRAAVGLGQCVLRRRRQPGESGRKGNGKQGGTRTAGKAHRVFLY